MNKTQLAEIHSSKKLREYFAGMERKELLANVRHVSASGMTRKISFYVVDVLPASDGADVIARGELVNVTYHVANALGFKIKNFNGRDVINVQGAGMDMCFKVTYDLSATLYGDGYAISSRTI